jgi:hypothetical protein
MVGDGKRAGILIDGRGWKKSRDTNRRSGDGKRRAGIHQGNGKRVEILVDGRGIEKEWRYMGVMERVWGY